jgi:hypothetical protein
MADRKAFNWRAARDDDFVVPIAKGMARPDPANGNAIVSSLMLSFALSGTPRPSEALRYSSVMFASFF